MRDVSELRRRDRLLLSKDATIREIHHRVKNNLQTISSLLRLQGRRLSSPEAKAAIDESVRRIRTIALVHETLSREAGDDVAFVEIVRPLARMAEESLQSPDRPVRFRVAGRRRASCRPPIATPLAVVLTELLQNAVDHAFPEGGRAGSRGRRCWPTTTTTLHVRVVDDGVGLPDGLRPRAGDRARPVDRAHARHHRAGRHASRCAPATPDDLAAAGLAVPRTGTGTVVELRDPGWRSRALSRLACAPQPASGRVRSVAAAFWRAT